MIIKRGMVNYFVTSWTTYKCFTTQNARTSILYTNELIYCEHENDKLTWLYNNQAYKYSKKSYHAKITGRNAYFAFKTASSKISARSNEDTSQISFKAGGILSIEHLDTIDAKYDAAKRILEAQTPAD